MTTVAVTASAIRADLACDAPRCACRRSRSRATHCPVHRDEHPSLIVDEREGRVLVHCHAGCAQAEVIAALERRGVWSPRGGARAPRAPAQRRSWLDDARADVLRQARRQLAKLAPYAEHFADAGVIRALDRTAAQARRLATALGPAVDAGWELLVQAAGLETEACALEAELDAEVAAL